MPTCDTTQAEAIVQEIHLAADTLLKGSPDSTADCDAVSIGLAFEGVPDAPPALVPPDCAPKK